MFFYYYFFYFLFFIVHLSKQGQEFKLSVATLRLNLSQEIPGEGGVIPKRKNLGIKKKKKKPVLGSITL